VEEGVEGALVSLEDEEAEEDGPGASLEAELSSFDELADSPDLPSPLVDFLA